LAIGTLAPGTGRAETLVSTLTFDLNVDSPLGILGAPNPLKLAGTLTADYSAGSGVDIDAQLDLVPAFEYSKDDVTAALGSGQIRFQLPGNAQIQIDVMTPGVEPVGLNPGPGGQIPDPAFAGLIWNYALRCVIDHCGQSVHFKITAVDDPNNPNAPDPKFAPLSYSANNIVHQLYFSIDVTNIATGARGTVGATLRQPEVPVPGAAWLMSTVLAAVYGCGRWRRRVRA
jgi:hypothetical protein